MAQKITLLAYVLDITTRTPTFRELLSALVVQLDAGQGIVTGCLPTNLSRIWSLPK